MSISVTGYWRRFWSSPPLTLNGWVAFNLPTTVSALGVTLLLAITGIHGYLWWSTPTPPAVFTGYVVLLGAACLIAAVLMFAPRVEITEPAWFLGSAACLSFLAVYLGTRADPVAGLTQLTGRWDVAPGSALMACAALFLVLHATVLSGINVARPQWQNWHD
ncbi:hypothetical protein [Mycobacterium sp. 1274756.6]|uniref:hypothetical protein n=1 Tax=Mycobacterium sp. 1274756.6 TaxID=1834076 RepID=UPI0007FCF512|nr:hypothetical protein [Mycobacterium sp. 1274756.6]OBJ72450.1 hypothetical protein A5643_05530 [Mycobacterium sp. 1274756.6]